MTWQSSTRTNNNNNNNIWNLYSAFCRGIQSAVILLPLVNHQNHVASFRCATMKAHCLSALRLWHPLFNTAAPHSPWVRGCFWLNQTCPNFEGRKKPEILAKTCESEHELGEPFAHTARKPRTHWCKARWITTTPPAPPVHDSWRINYDEQSWLQIDNNPE